MRKTLLLLCVLSLVTVLAASTPAPDARTAASSTAIRTYLLPDLSLKSVISPEMLPALPPALTQSGATALAQAPRKRGTCRCSCGYPCATDADCGGTTCDAFISCCDKSPRDKDTELFYQGMSNSSRKTALPEEVLKNLNCK
jgi:hypothetical protein